MGIQERVPTTRGYNGANVIYDHHYRELFLLPEPFEIKNRFQREWPL